MNLVKHIKSFGLLFGIVSLVIGIVLVVKPTQTEILINMIVGVGLIVMGIIEMIQSLIRKKQEERPAIIFIIPLLIVILGVFILIDSNVTMFTTGIIISMFAFLLAFDRLIVAIKNKKLEKSIKITVVYGLIHLIFGSVMLWNTFVNMTGTVMLTGVYLIVNGAMITSSVILLNDFK